MINNICKRLCWCCLASDDKKNNDFSTGSGYHPLTVRSDADFRLMLSTMVHEANFLVENNLSFLVEEIEEKEQKLFKLDSILSAVGIEGETEVLKIIRDSLAASSGRDGSFNRESILKAIRGFVLILELSFDIIASPVEIIELPTQSQDNMSSFW